MVIFMQQSKINTYRKIWHLGDIQGDSDMSFVATKTTETEKHTWAKYALILWENLSGNKSGL